ncbi:MAG: AbrB family transcriptional regulator [Thermoproteota archaeon]|nr:MAG: AbrB family transcriptional regulator [Candidatus Korarchaeota archaeon]RLG48319.1 MAG: AbrB family transcriptional regulator [Candidatus Korarchaeota archaeon]
MTRVKVTRSYQVTIPKEIRERIGLKEGDYLQVEVDDEGRIILSKSRRKRRTLRAGRPLKPDEIEKLIELGIKRSLISGE